MFKRLQCLFTRHEWHLIIRKDLQGGSFYECKSCGHLKDN